VTKEEEGDIPERSQLNHRQEEKEEKGRKRTTSTDVFLLSSLVHSYYGPYYSPLLRFSQMEYEEESRMRMHHTYCCYFLLMFVCRWLSSSRR
jgi:hypothetical protein